MHFNSDQFRSGIEPNSVSSQTFDGDAGRQPSGRVSGLASGYTDALASSATTPTAGTPEPIAICGLALRLPGGIRSAEGFWDVLKNGKDTRGPIPPDRYNVDGFSNAMGKKGAIQTEYGYFLNEDLSCLDTSFFSMGKSELEKMDPQQRQILEVARECLESAGEVSYRGKQIGCYVGTFGEDWLQSQSRESQYTGGYNVSGDLMIANRVSYEYDLRGPSLVIKTGCSASLVCLHEACRALQAGDCSAALVAGTSLIMGPSTTAAMTREGILSPEGSCKSFDAAADGFARGEGINAVYVKRLDDAIRDKNPIRAIIRNTGTNSDGKSQGLMAPNGEAHEALMRSIYREARLNPAETALVECHGTGTPTGDPIETKAVGNVFGESGVYISSVKPNVGHSEGASGITSLIKAILALENKIIPPNIKFMTPNPKIPFEEKKLTVPTKPTPWPKDRRERVSINSFGIGGTNAHVILDSAAEFLPRSFGAGAEQSKNPKLLIFSANSPNALKQLVGKYQEYIQLHPDRLMDISYTLSQRREHLPHRAFGIVKHGSSVFDLSSAAKVSRSEPSVSIIFSGQGAQWPQMGKDLIESDPEFRGDIRAMDDILQSLKHPPIWSIEDELLKPAGITEIHRAEMAQPLCTAVQLALFNVLIRSGIQPSAVVGHSSGEIAAAYATGSISVSEAVILSYYRGYVTKRQKLTGGMAAVGLDSGAASAFLRDGVVVACENSPSSTTISGDLDQLQEVILSIKEKRPEVMARQLKVDMAYHSHHMKSLARQYIDLIHTELMDKRISRSEPRVPFYSSVTLEVIRSSAGFSPAYWASNLTSPVRFSGAVNRLLQEQPQNILLEIGPHSTLAGPLRQICAEARTQCLYVPTMLRSVNCSESLLSAFGQLHQHGVAVKFESFVPVGQVLSDLPAYPWEHTASYWHESRISKEWRFRPHGHHSLLGQRTSETTSFPCWRVVLDLEDEPWLGDHKVGNDVVFPFAGYISMAGEAIRQITGVQDGYSIRHVVAHTALVLTESKPVELVTVLRPHKLTDSSSSSWCDFEISSYTGSSWIKNCEGRVGPGANGISAKPSPIEALPRRVPASLWYGVMARVGFNYGPEFRGITSISTSTTELVAAGEIVNSEARQQQPFLFHPATIDACLQLVLAAIAQGAGRNFTELCVPTMMEELDVSRSALAMDAKAWYLNEGNNVGLDCIADGKTILRLRGARLTPLGEEENAAISSDPHAAARLEWYPDFDFVDVKPLFATPPTTKESKHLLEELALLCILDSAERLEGLDTDKEHFKKFRDWLRREVHHAQSGTYPVIADAANYARFSRPDRLKAIKDKVEILSKIPLISAVTTGIMRIFENAEGLFTGKVDTLNLLMEDSVLTEIYNIVSFDYRGFVRMLSVTKPNLRILEVGAGTGGTTELILRGVVGAGGKNPAYSIYTFTDISAGFFPQARERFSYAPNMDYKIFDISRSPFEQGFEAESYDLILAPNVVHATPSLKETLENLRPLLRPDGHLVLSEVCAVVRVPGYIFGNFSGWWLGEADGRKWEPYIDVNRWDQELRATGFTGVDSAIYDSEEPYQYGATIVTQPKSGRAARPDSQRVTVLCDQPSEGVSQKLIRDLKGAGYIVSIAKLGGPPSLGQDILATLDLENPFFEKIPEERFLAFQNLLRHRHQSQKLLWLMPPTQIRCTDPRASQTIGMFRVIRAELAIPLHTLEINPTEAEFSKLAMQVFQKVCSREDTGNLAPDREFAVDEGVVKIGRYQPFSLRQEVSEKGMREAGGASVKRLEIAKAGLMETLRWVEGNRMTEIGNDMVEVETRAAGLNFHDIAVSLGIISYMKDSFPLGLELSGIVRKVGRNVRNVSVGDRVCALAFEGCFSTSAVIESPLVVKIPDELSFEDAAGMPLCFATVIQSLIDVGRLERGQSVLIHSASGGVGLAAIQICRIIGAEIYTTVGTEEKVQYLMNKFCIPRNRIFHSRDESFLSDVLRETGGRGVDLVLNSLSGELLHASWKCVAEFGKLIELGKRDLAGFGKLDLEPFLRVRSYCSVDIAHCIKERPVATGRVLQSMMEWYKQGHVRPINPTALFDASEIQQSFRYLAQGDHIGKAVVKIPEDVSKIPSIPRATSITFDPEAAYLLTGGLGGLGRSIATWMVERGARHLTFLSRSAGSGKADRAFFAELESMGCAVSPVAGYVQGTEDVKRAISLTPKPVKGIIHLAMVLRDAAVLEMTHEEWTGAIGPKVDGAWNLHNAFLGQSLDFFIMASSLVAHVDLAGQSNYAATCTFLESFCQYRHTLGLPASVLSICPVDDIGFVAVNPAVKKRLKSQGLYFVAERELLDYIEFAILTSHPPTDEVASPNVMAPWKSSGHLLMGLRSETHLDSPSCQTSWRRDRRMGTYHNVTDSSVLTAGETDSATKLKSFLARCSDDPSILRDPSAAEYFAKEIGRKVMAFMMKPDDEEVDIERGLAQVGLDSLMAIELRKWWKGMFGLEVSVLEILGVGSLRELGKLVVEGLAKKHKED